MSGPARKPRRQRQNKPQRLGDLALVRPKVPAAPAGLLKVTGEVWAAYWRSELSKLVDPDSDMPAILRLFRMYDERERAHRNFVKARIVKGSKGQPRINPLASFIKDLDAEIRQLEDRLGMTPKARLQLGITFGDAMRSLHDLNRDLQRDDEEEDDPRLAIKA